MSRDSRKSQKHGNRGNWDFHQMPWIHYFVKMPCFAFFGQNALVLCFYKNILFLISISLSLLYEFNTKIFTFASATKVRVALLLTSSICDRDVIIEMCIFLEYYIFIELETTSFSCKVINWTLSMLDVELYRLYNGLRPVIWCRSVLFDCPYWWAWYFCFHLHCQHNVSHENV